MKKILLLLIVCYVGFICWTRLPVLEQATLETANHEFALRLITLNTEYWHTSEVEMLAQLDYTKMDFVLLQEHLEQRGDSYFPTNR
ncbi:MAG: hypothetical protein MI864_21825, partial [Pseudomonadales bacterium]|nr:hypothetical protein [Pseudomonadales bacterium]